MYCDREVSYNNYKNISPFITKKFLPSFSNLFITKLDDPIIFTFLNIDVLVTDGSFKQLSSDPTDEVPQPCAYSE